MLKALSVVCLALAVAGLTAALVVPQPATAVTAPQTILPKTPIERVQSDRFGGCGQACPSGGPQCGRYERPRFRSGNRCDCVGESTSGQRC